MQAEVARRGGLGLKRIGHELIGPCPRCGGDDRFAINTAKQLWHCRACAAGGDIVDLIQHIDGVDFRTAVRTLGGDRTDMVSSGEVTKRDHRSMGLANQSSIDGQNTKWALKLWNDAVPIAGTLGERYLHGRGLHDLPGDAVLRFHRSAPFGKSRSPCLLALYTDIETNEPQAIGRTALSAAGVKVGRLSLGPTRGCAVKLTPDEDVAEGLAVGEGVETTLAAMQLGFKPAWALGSSGAIARFEVLAGISALTIIADNDPPDRNGRQAGQEAALACSARWTAAGVGVIRIVPRRLGADMADIIIEQGGEPPCNSLKAASRGSSTRRQSMTGHRLSAKSRRRNVRR